MKRDEEDAPRVLTAKCLEDLVQYVPAPGEVVRIRVPLETKLSEFKKMAEYADSKKYELLDDRPGMGFPWKMRVESKLTGIDQTMEELAKRMNRAKATLDRIERRRAADSGDERVGAGG